MGRRSGRELGREGFFFCFFVFLASGESVPGCAALGTADSFWLERQARERPRVRERADGIRAALGTISRVISPGFFCRSRELRYAVRGEPTGCLALPARALSGKHPAGFRLEICSPAWLFFYPLELCSARRLMTTDERSSPRDVRRAARWVAGCPIQCSQASSTAQNNLCVCWA